MLKSGCDVVGLVLVAGSVVGGQVTGSVVGGHVTGSVEGGHVTGSVVGGLLSGFMNEEVSSSISHASMVAIVAPPDSCCSEEWTFPFPSLYC